MHLALRVICNATAATAVVLTTGSVPAHAAPGPLTSTSPPAAASSTTVPWTRPRCPERAPAGAVFVRRVQPLAGLGYDLYSYRGKPLYIFC